MISGFVAVFFAVRGSLLLLNRREGLFHLNLEYSSGGKSPARISSEILINKFLFELGNCESILEVGSKNSIHRNLLGNSNYVALDIVDNPNIDLVADVHNIPIRDNFFDLVLCIEVLEHLENPALAISEMRRVLKKNGTLILSTRFIFPLHPDPKDYYRFTPDSLSFLCRNFKDVQIVPAGNILVSLIMIFLHSLPSKLQKHRLVSFFGKVPTKKNSRFACGYVLKAIK